MATGATISLRHPLHILCLYVLRHAEIRISLELSSQSFVLSYNVELIVVLSKVHCEDDELIDCYSISIILFCSSYVPRSNPSQQH